MSAVDLHAEAEKLASMTRAQLSHVVALREGVVQSLELNMTRFKVDWVEAKVYRAAIDEAQNQLKMARDEMRERQLSDRAFFMPRLIELD